MRFKRVFFFFITSVIVVLVVSVLLIANTFGKISSIGNMQNISRTYIYAQCSPRIRASDVLLSLIAKNIFPCNSDNILVLHRDDTELIAKCLVERIVIRTPLNSSTIRAVFPRNKRCKLDINGCFKYYLVYAHNFTLRFYNNRSQIFYCYKTDEYYYCSPRIVPGIIVCYSATNATSSYYMWLRISSCLYVNSLRIYCFTENSVGLLKMLCFKPFQDLENIPLKQLHQFTKIIQAFRRGLNNITFSIRIYLVKSVKSKLGRPFKVSLPNEIEITIAYPYIEETNCR